MVKFTEFKREDDPELLANIEKSRGRRIENNFLGHFLLEESLLTHLDSAEIYDKHFYELIKIFEFLKNTTDEHRQNFFRNAFRDSEFREKIIDKFKYDIQEIWSHAKEYSDSTTLEEYSIQELPGHLSLDFDSVSSLGQFDKLEMVEAVIAYTRAYLERRKSRMEMIKNWNKQFIDDLQSFTKSRGLVFDQSRINQRIETLSYDIFDDYYLNKIGAGHVAADYNSETHTIRGMLEPNFTDLKGNHYHELIHAISGTRNIMSIRDIKGHDMVVIERQTERLGFKKYGKSLFNDRFMWLNEAVTEQCRMDMMVYNQSIDPNNTDIEDFGYENERKLLALILIGGNQNIPIEYIYNAYFETDTEIGELPHRKVLFDSIRNAYSENTFFLKLDDLIRNNNIQYTLKLFRDGGANAVLGEWNKIYKK